MELTGAQILLESLKREGVDLIFGYPGGAVLDIYDELSRSSLKHILVRHEQAAVHAADGYARASGKVGVCLVTSGPGATNAVTGIATAYSDSIPMVVLTGQVGTPLIGNDAFQEVDIVGITRPCTKHNYLVKDVKKLPEIIRQAFYLARSGRPGPVLIDLPKDVVKDKTEFIWPPDVQLRSYNPTYKPNLVQLRKAADLLLAAKQPVILAGGGVIMSNAGEALCALAKERHIPVASTLMGLGSYPGDDQLWLGMAGMHGTVVSNRALQNADLLIAVGTRFSDRVTGRVEAFTPNAKIVHIDIDPTSIHKSVHVDIPVVADCRLALEALNDILRAGRPKDWENEHKPWLHSLAAIREKHSLHYSRGAGIKPQQVIETVYAISKGNAIITTEVGQHQMWAAQFYTFTKPRTFVSSGGLGTMGYGFPAAIGAQFAHMDKLVIDIAGDGSIQMNIQELATAVHNKLPVKIIILNNCYLGMVRQWQELFYDKNYAYTCIETQPDFVKLAEAYGAEGYRVSNPDDLEATLAKALSSPNTAIIDIKVEREENVYPMIPTGGSVDDMLLV